MPSSAHLAAMMASPSLTASPMASPINPAEIKAIALKVKQRLSSRISASQAATEPGSSWTNPLASPLPRASQPVLSAASGSAGPPDGDGGDETATAPTGELGAPRPTDSGPRLLSVATDRSVRTDEGVRAQQTWSEEFDIDDGATPTPHLSPRSRECTMELVLAPATVGSSATTSRSLDLGPWSTESVTPTGPPGRAVLPYLPPQLSLAPVDDDHDHDHEAHRPAAPRGPTPDNHFLADTAERTCSVQTMESVRLSCESAGSERAVECWRELPASVSVAAAGSPDTIRACSGIPVLPGAMRPAHTQYRFRVQQGERVLVIETRYKHMHKLSRQLQSLLQSELPNLPPKLRGAARLSATVISQRQAAFREFIEAAIAAVAAPQEPNGNSGSRKLKRKGKRPDVDAASARLQRFLTRAAVGTEDVTPISGDSRGCSCSSSSSSSSSSGGSDECEDTDVNLNDGSDDDAHDCDLGTELRPVPAEGAGGGPLHGICGGSSGGDRRRRRPRLTTAAATLASAIVASAANVPQRALVSRPTRSQGGAVSLTRPSASDDDNACVNTCATAEGDDVSDDDCL